MARPIIVTVGKYYILSVYKLQLSFQTDLPPTIPAVIPGTTGPVNTMCVCMHGVLLLDIFHFLLPLAKSVQKF